MLGSAMFGPPRITRLAIGDKKIDLGAAEAFIGDLYLNAGLELPDEFNPVDELVRVVETLRKQGAQNGKEVS